MTLRPAIVKAAAILALPLALEAQPALVWQQSFGGGGTEQFEAVAVGPDGTVYGVGTTQSTDLAAGGGAQPSYQGGSGDIFVARFTADGELLNATYLGGSSRDEGNDIAVHPNGAVYVVGSTDSADFPTTEGALRTELAGAVDAALTILTDDLSVIAASTFLGGSGFDLGFALAFDTVGPGVFIAGSTASGDFPDSAPGAQQNDGSDDIFIGKVDPWLTRIQRIARLGGAGGDFPVDIAIGPHGDPHLAGITNRLDSLVDQFPTDSTDRIGDGGGVDSFVVEYSVDLSSIQWAASVGGEGDDQAFGFTHDEFGNLYLGGRSTGGLPTTANAPIPNHPGGPTSGFIVCLPIGETPTGLPQLEQVSTYTGDANRNAVLDLHYVNQGGKRGLLVSESNFTEVEAPVTGCPFDPPQGVTGKLTKWEFDPETGALRPPGEGQCIPNTDLRALAEDPPTTEQSVPTVLRNDLQYAAGLIIQSSGQSGVAVSIAPPTPPAGADLELAKSVFGRDAIVTIGGTARFNLDVRNNGPDAAINVRVTDTLPREFVYRSFVGDGNCTAAGQVVTCELGTIAPRGTKGVQLLVSPPDFETNVVNTARATADNLDGPDRVDTAEVRVRRSVFLSLSKTATRTDSGLLEFTITVRNSFAADATNVTIEDVLPAELLDPVVEHSRGECELNLASPLVRSARSTLNCRLESLGQDSPWTVVVRGRPKNLRAQISNHATVASDQTGTSNIPRSAYINQTAGAAAADLTIGMAMQPASEDIGMMCSQLLVRVFNNGLNGASGVMVSLSQLSAGVIFRADEDCTVSGRSVRCNLGRVDPYQLRNLNFTVCGSGGARDARFRGLVTAETPDPDPTNNVNSTGARLDAGDVGFQLFGTNSSSGFHRPGVVSPGSDPSLFGAGLAPETVVADTAPFPLQLAGVSLEIGGVPAPLVFVSPGQINFQTPWELEPGRVASMVVRNNGRVSMSDQVLVAAVNPGIFTTARTGSGQASVLIAGTASVAGAEGSLPGARPVRIGEFISIFATGLGAVDNQPATGARSPSGPLARTTTTPVVTIGGVQAPVSFSGLAPGFIGLFQVNAEVAAGTPTGDAVDLRMTSAEVPSNEVTIAVAP